MTFLQGEAARWRVHPPAPDLETRLVDELKIPRLLARILVRRGFHDVSTTERYLNPRTEDFHDPSLLPDYDAAVRTILEARERGTRVFVHGDYDVDGVSSAALLYRFLRRLGMDVIAFVPHRLKHGYGISLDAVDEAAHRGAGLLISCDCGSNAGDQVEKARAHGMKVVVTDHHEVGGDNPPADAFVNPRRHDSRYPFASLAGVGVAFKLCAGITRDLGLPIQRYYRAFLDLATLGTIADVMPLVDENRVIVRYGLDLLWKSKKVGLRALAEEYLRTQNKKLHGFTVRDVSFGLGPRLNATGRIDAASRALDLLISEDEEEARGLAREIEELNLLRREEQERAVESAVQRLQEEGVGDRYVIAMYDASWGPGIVGLVAGKLKDQFNRPTFIGTLDETSGLVKASARSIDAFHLADAIKHLEPLVSGGGHAKAAGLACTIENWPRFAAEIDAFAKSILRPEDLVAQFEVDAEIDPSEADVSMVEALERMEPCGMGNEQAVLLARRVELQQAYPTKNERVSNLRLGIGAQTVKAFAFGDGPRLRDLALGTSLDVLFRPERDDWVGNDAMKWSIKDYRVSGGAATLWDEVAG